jgi:hypothetical protein
MPIESSNSVIHAARSFLTPNIKRGAIKMDSRFRTVLTHSVQTQ